MAIEVPQNKEISGGGRKRVGSAIRWGGANRGGVHIFGNKSEEEWLGEMLTPT